jgi:hypothetical protein
MLCNDLTLIESHVYEQLSKVYVQDRISYAKHEVEVHTILAAYYLMLQIEASYTQQPLNVYKTIYIYTIHSRQKK